MAFLFLGVPGAGKDTQADLICKNFGYISISLGEVFRNKMHLHVEDEDLAKQVSESLDKGHLLEDELVYAVLDKEFTNYYDKTGDQNFIFTGTVRRDSQVPLFDAFLSKHSIVLEKVVYFELPIEEIVERITLRRFCPTCARNYHLKYNPPKSENICDDDGTALQTRKDDTQEIAETRIQYFIDTTQPILAEYKKRGILLTVDARRPIKNIYQQLILDLNLVK